MKKIKKIKQRYEARPLPIITIIPFKLASQKIGIGKRYDKELYKDFPPSITLFSFCFSLFACLFLIGLFALFCV